MVTFLTILATMVTFIGTLGIIVTVYEFSKLNDMQQKLVTIEYPMYQVVTFFMSVAYLLSKLFS